MENILVDALDYSNTFMINNLNILFRPYGPIMLPIPVITIILMLATKIRNYRDNFIVYPKLPFFQQPPKNLESSRLNLIVLIIIFVSITGHHFYSSRQVKFILIKAVFSWSIFIRAVIDHMTCYNLNWPKIKS